MAGASPRDPSTEVLASAGIHGVVVRLHDLVAGRAALEAAGFPVKEDAQSLVVGVEPTEASRVAGSAGRPGSVSLGVAARRGELGRGLPDPDRRYTRRLDMTRLVRGGGPPPSISANGEDRRRCPGVRCAGGDPAAGLGDRPTGARIDHDAEIERCVAAEEPKARDDGFVPPTIPATVASPSERQRRCQQVIPPVDPDFMPSDVEDVSTNTSALLILLGFIVGASFIGADWQAGVIPTTLSWESRRTRLVAKLAAVVGSVFVVAVVWRSSTVPSPACWPSRARSAKPTANGFGR